MFDKARCKFIKFGTGTQNGTVAFFNIIYIYNISKLWSCAYVLLILKKKKTTKKQKQEKENTFKECFELMDCFIKLL